MLLCSLFSIIVFQYYWFLSLLLLVQIVLIILVFIFYFAEDIASDWNLVPEDLLKDAIVKYRDDPDMRNVIDDLQEFVSCSLFLYWFDIFFF